MTKRWSLLLGLTLMGGVLPMSAPLPAVATQEEASIHHVRLLLEGRYQEVFERFDTAMQRAFPMAAIQKVLDPERASRGALTDLKRGAVETRRGFQVVQVEARFDRGLPLLFTISLHPDGRIAGLRFKPGAGQVDRAQLDKAIAEFPGKLSIAALVAEKPEIHFRFQDQTPMSVGSQFKVLVLAKAAERLAEGSLKESQRLPIGPLDRSFPSGVLHLLEPGIQPMVSDLLGLMISISDNTATDTLMHALGRSAIEGRLAAWGFKSQPPLLTTGEMFALAAGLGGLPEDPQQRLAYLKGLGRAELYQAAERSLAALAQDRGQAEAAVDRYFGQIDYGIQRQLSHTLDWRLSTAELADFYRRVSTGTFQSAAVSQTVDRYLQKGGAGIIGGLLQQDARIQRFARKGGSDIGIMADGGYVTLQDGRHLVMVLTANELPSDVDENTAIQKLSQLSQLIFEHLAAGQ